jgi:hypothetical protein
MRNEFNLGAEAVAPAHVRAAELDVFKRSVERSGLSAESFIQALTQTSLSSLVSWDQLDLEALLLAAERYGVSPIGREIYLLKHELRPEDPPMVVLGVDGWSRVLNGHKKFAGMEFNESTELVEGVPAWIECTLHRWDRRVPTTVREYFNEVRGSSTAWITHPRRMLRHKALVQCARLAFAMVGVYDHDEVQRITDATAAAGNGASKRRGGARSSAPMGVEAVKRHLALRAA